MKRAKKTKGALPKDLTTLLKNWNTLNDRLLELSEEQVTSLLEHEKKNENRLTFKLRLQSRVNRMRALRERAALARG